MKMDTISRASSSHSNAVRIVFLIVFCFCLMASVLTIQAQQHVLVKTFDPNLKKLTNVGISINGKPYVEIGSKGEAIAELEESDFPLKTIRIKDDQFEVASWNYSKGVIEVIIRKKTHKTAIVYLQDSENNTLKNISIVFKGQKTTTATTDQEGKIEIPLALDEKITSSSQFTVNDYQVVNILTSDLRSVLTVRQNKPKAEVVQETKKVKAEIHLDSIRTLEQFYALFKNFQTADLTDERRRQLNEKLKQLMAQFEDSVRGAEVQHMEKITDSSAVGQDIKNIISQATIENEKLSQQRDQFNDKIRVINKKLARGVLNIDTKTRDSLLADITRLEIVLESNRSSFYKNQEDYRSILNTIKEKFLHIEDLQNKLSLSETQRQEEHEVFQRKLFITISIAVLSVLLVVLLVYFSSKLRKQKRALMVANAAVQHMNENLEQLVQQRTHMLEETNRELDTFLYKASHNLRSPVSSMIGLYNIANKISDPNSKELFERAVQTAYAMDRLLLKLKVISEINRQFEPLPFNLAQLINEVGANFQMRIHEYKISFQVECAADLELNSNRNLVEAILLSLVENAIYYCSLKASDNRQVRVIATKENDFVVLSIYDNGIGIPHNIQPQVFDMFFVGNEASRGDGLGLYIVQKAVLAIRGSIRIESEENVFTRFVVRIPA